jgi:cellobiose epimerase
VTRRTFLVVSGAAVAGAAAWAASSLLPGGGRRATTADGAAYRSIRLSLLEHLDQDVLPFWVSARINDEAHGGYLPHLDWNLRPTGAVERHFIVQLRLLYVHAVAISRAKGEELRTRLLDQYHRRFAFVRRRYEDARNGGFFSQPSDVDVGPKETSSQVHVVYLLSEVFLLIGHEEALELARAVFSLIDSAARDPVHGGYREHLGAASAHPRNVIKTLVVHMHMLLALTRLHQARPERIHLDRVEELASLLVSHFEIPNSRGNTYNALTLDWREIPPAGTTDTRTVYGHSAELIWYMLESARVLGKDVQKLGPWAARLADGLLRSGIRESGAVYFAGAYRGAAEDRTVWWWSQAEAMVAMLRVWEVTGEARYWDAFERIRDWTFRHIVRDRSGTWMAFTNRWGFQAAPLRAGGYWQSGYHATRALLACEQSLARLIARGAQRPADSPRRQVDSMGAFS